MLATPPVVPALVALAGEYQVTSAHAGEQMKRKDRSLFPRLRTEGFNGKTSNIVVAEVSPSCTRPPPAQNPGEGAWDAASGRKWRCLPMTERCS